MELLVILLLVIIVIGVFPAWPYSSSWGYGPSSVTGIFLILLVILLLTGRV